MTEKKLEQDLSNVIARHADWLDGRTFQQACQRVAEAYFEPGDLDTIPSAAELGQAFAEALERALDDPATD